jgi:hypothetical protein
LRRKSSHSPAAKIAASAYDRAYSELLSDAIQGLIAGDRLLGAIKRSESRHTGPVRNVRGDNPLDQPPHAGSAVSSLEINAFKTFDIDAHTVSVYETAQEVISVHSRAVLAGMCEIADAAGMTVKDDGVSAPIEHFRELLRRLELEFDEDGNISGNWAISVPPEYIEIAKALMTEAGKDPECQRIISEKRQTWLGIRAEKNIRKLPR